MGSSGSVLNDNGYTLVSEEKMMMLVKNKYDDLFAIKKLKNAYKEHVSDFLQKLSHPHIVHYEEIITDSDCLHLVLEHCEGGNLAQKIQLKKEQNVPFYKMMTKSQGDQTMEYNQILDWTVKICMALKHLHDQQILHKNLQPKSIFFTACGTIRLGEFGQINKWSSDTQTTQTEDFSYVAPEILNGKVYDEKSEIWSLGRIIYEMCMLKCAFLDRSTIAIMSKILKGSYEALPVTFPADLRELVKDTLQVDPGCRPSVNQILTRPFVIKHLYEKSKQTIEELKVRKHKNSESCLEEPDIQRNPKVSLKVLEELADSLEMVHYNTTVGSLAGGVVGLAGGITSIVGVILAPFTLGVSLIVTGVGIGVGVAGGVAAGASNITKMVNQRSNRQNMKMIIRELQEKISSTIFCIQIIQIAINQHKTSKSNKSPGSSSWSNDWENSGPQPGLGGILKLMNSLQTLFSLLYILSVAVNVFFIALDAKEIHKLRQDYASTEAQRNSPTNKEQELQSEIMKFVKKIRETADELEKILEELKNELMQTEYIIGF